MEDDAGILPRAGNRSSYYKYFITARRRSALAVQERHSRQAQDHVSVTYLCCAPAINIVTAGGVARLTSWGAWDKRGCLRQDACCCVTSKFPTFKQFAHLRIFQSYLYLACREDTWRGDRYSSTKVL